MAAVYYKGAATQRDTQGKVWLVLRHRGHVPFLRGIRSYRFPGASVCPPTVKLRTAPISQAFVGVSLHRHADCVTTQLELQAPSSPRKLADQADSMGLKSCRVRKLSKVSP